MDSNGVNVVKMNKLPYRYKELDALRGVAALLVVLFHFTMNRSEANWGFKYGTTGVDLFFIISGFVIFMSLEKVHTSKEFIINRISRLYPTYWACVTFTFTLIIITSILSRAQIPFIQYIGNMSMFQYYLRIPSLEDPYWTMIVEMLFYIGVLFLFHYKLLKHIVPIGLAAALSAVAISTFLPFSLIRIIFRLIPLLEFSPLFLAGIIFYKIHTGKNRQFFYFSILITCLICQIVLYKYAGRSRFYVSQTEYAAILSFYFLLFVLLVNGKLTFIVSAVSLFLGKISFVLYLIHQKISCDIIIPFLTEKYDLNFWTASIFISLPIVIGLAAIITYYIEVPLSQKMKEKLRTAFN